MKTRIALLFILLLALSSCGVKGRLVQAGKPLPAAPTGLTLQQKGEDMLLAWTAPTLNQDGTQLSDLHHFAVSRLSYRPGDYCDECLATDANQIRIYPDLPAPALLINNRFYLRDSDLSHNVGYRYQIVAVNSRGESGAEAKQHRIMLPPPPAPTSVQIKALDRSLQLKWETETGQTEQGRALGVNLYRAIGDGYFEPQPLNSEPISDGQYDDFNLVNDQLYRYRLRSVIEVNGQRLESTATGTVEGRPRTEF